LCEIADNATIVQFLMRTLRSHVRHFSLLLAMASLLASAASARPQSDSIFGPLPVFEFHSGFWLNLHHTLYREAKLRTTPPASSSADSAAAKSSAELLQSPSTVRPPLTSAELRIWTDAVNYYTAHFADHDLLFSNDLIILKDQLGDFEDCDELSGAKKKSCDAGLPPQLTHILESAGAVYRAHTWPAHDRANRRWIARVAPLVREQGLGLSERLASIYQAKWPKPKIRVDISAYANWAGAYTTLDPLRVTISSLDPRNQDSAALEVLFHEASHGIAEPVEQAIVRECRQRDKAIPRDLWHALIFYTTGEVIRPVMNASSDPQLASAQAANPSAPDEPLANSPNASVTVAGYTPYAVREGLYERGWDDYLKLLTRFWQPYLDGHSSFDDAIARMVSSL
jgi:hypothetical protein